METVEQKDKEILANIARENGWIPNPLKLMENRPGTVQTFMEHKARIFNGGPLNKKEQVLISLAVAAAIRSEHCMNVNAEEAKKEGINKDEIVQALLITSLMVGNSLLHIAYKAMNKSVHNE
jgi:AhpD family alkylhydroperoxidase